MKYHNIHVEIANKTAIVNIHRPEKYNALNAKTSTELQNAIKELEANANVSVLVITGNGEKAFMAGADIAELANLTTNEGYQLAKEGQLQLFERIENLSKPVIAAINGFALGGGLELAMACHLRIAAEHAKLGLPETSLGLLPGYGGTQRLPQLVGKGRALEMILTAKMITAQEALLWGLVNQICSAENLKETYLQVAKNIQKNAPLALGFAIKAVNASYKNNENGFETEAALFGKCFATNDFKEGTNAFLEKRNPIFTAR